MVVVRLNDYGGAVLSKRIGKELLMQERYDASKGLVGRMCHF